MLLPRFGELGMFSFRGSAFIYCYGCYNPESSTSRADVPFLLLRVDCSLRFFDPTMACSNGNPPKMNMSDTLGAKKQQIIYRVKLTKKNLKSWPSRMKLSKKVGHLLSGALCGRLRGRCCSRALVNSAC